MCLFITIANIFSRVRYAKNNIQCKPTHNSNRILLLLFLLFKFLAPPNQETSQEINMKLKMQANGNVQVLQDFDQENKRIENDGKEYRLNSNMT